MPYIHPRALDYERQRWLRPNAHIFIRRDWRRFVQRGSELEAYYESIERKRVGHKYSFDQPRAPFAGAKQAAYGAQGSGEYAEGSYDIDDRSLNELRAIKSELLQLKWLAAAARLELAMRRHDRALRRALKYSAEQPRVPRGNPDGGQWTTQLAQNERQRQEPIKLEDEELRGGHTIEFHVNRSEQALKAQAQAEFDRNPDATDVRSGSFSSLAAANKLVNSTLAQNQNIVDRVAAGVINEKVVISEFNSITGIEAVAPSPRSQPYIQETYKVGVFIIHDPYASRGYRIYTSFPTNRRR